MMKKIIAYFDTIIRLGLLNVAYVIWYRFSIKSGIRKFFFKSRCFCYSGNFYSSIEQKKDFPDCWKPRLIADAEKIINGQIRYYAYHWKNVGPIPNWFLNPFNKVIYPYRDIHWTKLPDFDPAVGDIKNIWEASRFEWVVTLSRAYVVTGKSIYLDTLNQWLNDWAEKNPLNVGPNWKCGQEASIRIFNLLNAALILEQAEKPTTNLCDIIYSHLERINGNVFYAIAQDNNHGTSEAAGLFIGGIWLKKINAKKYTRADYYSKKGRFWLENRVIKLIEADGSFSQHSITYHRVLLDTLCFAEFWRSKLNEPLFSDRFYKKAKSATGWLELFTDKQTGNAPNLGSNDGAFLLNLSGCDYRDFRPSVLLANCLFNGAGESISDHSTEVLYWFSQQHKQTTDTKKSKSKVLKSGYTYLKSGNSWALIRFPYFRFRPSHNDAMHFDLWFKGQNVITDSGTYSYNPTDNEIEYDLKSVHFHNTVSFDSKEQMPKLSRFLLGSWLKADSIGKISNADGIQEWSGSYIDNSGNYHLRKITLRQNCWEISDTLSGPFEEAIIGFNLSDYNCEFQDSFLKTNFGNIFPPKHMEVHLIDSIASKYYFEKHLTKRITFKTKTPGTYTTVIELK